MAPTDKKDGAEKPPPTDWAKIYSLLLFHTGIHYEEIGRRTLPQINALLSQAQENISIKVGMPNVFGAGAENNLPSNVQTQAPDKPPKLSQFIAFADCFNN